MLGGLGNNSNFSHQMLLSQTPLLSTILHLLLKPLKLSVNCQSFLFKMLTKPQTTPFLEGGSKFIKNSSGGYTHIPRRKSLYFDSLNVNRVCYFEDNLCIVHIMYRIYTISLLSNICIEGMLFSDTPHPYRNTIIILKRTLIGFLHED